MPRTRSQIDRKAKVDQVLDAAERRVLEGGYAALSVVSLARELGVAQNAIYWYFPSKDELFVSVLRRLLERVTLPNRTSKGGAAGQVLAVVDRLGELQALRASMQERALQSHVVAEFAVEFRQLLRGLLEKALRDAVPASELGLAVDTFMSTTAGTYAQGLDTRQRRRVLRFMLRRLLGD